MDEDEEFENERVPTWYALKVQPEREERIKNLIAEKIRNKGMGDVIRTILIPTESVSEVRKDGKKRVVDQKTYPGYLFIEMDMDNDDAWYIITETAGVSGFVSADPRKPQPLPDEEMDHILKVIDDGKERPKPKVEFEAGEQVRIKEGPFGSYEGVVEEVYPDRGQVNVFIFGRSTPVELGYHQVERV
ncbi:MAG: transcription termination/antitermination protein NusG [Planctomycetaceae bacterium]|nr:transcription termination/antitermination protein NusG [Planctomycetaceae bacterium]